jgi:hypothetical protein
MMGFYNDYKIEGDNRDSLKESKMFALLKGKISFAILFII